MKKNDSSTKRLDDFDENLLKEFDEILGNPGTGSSTQERILPSGRKITHHCSWSTGMGWLHSLKNYESNFGDAPSWLIYFHPVHRIRLCKLAIAFNSPIPEKSSNIINWIKDKIFHEKNKSNELNETYRVFTLEESLPILSASEIISILLEDNFGPTSSKEMIKMMKKGKFIGEIGYDLHDFLIDEIHNESEIAWEGEILGSEDEYSISVNGYHGIFFVRALEYDDYGFFSNINDAKSYILSEWDCKSIIDKSIVRKINYNFNKINSTFIKSSKKNNILNRISKIFGMAEKEAKKLFPVGCASDGNIDEVFHFLLEQEIWERPKQVWIAPIKPRDDDGDYSYEDYQAEIQETRRVYRIWVPRCGFYGYFSTLMDAKNWLLSQEKLEANFLTI